MLNVGKPISWKLYYITAIISVIVCIAAYFYLSYNQHQFNPKDTTIPNFQQLLVGLHKIATPDSSGDYWLYEDIKATFSRLFLGLGLGIIFSLTIGLLMGCFEFVEAIFIYPVSFFARIPPTAMMAVYFVLFGTGTNMFIAIISLGVSPILIQTIFQSVKKDIEPYMLDKAYTLGASNFEILFHVVFKQILPRIIEAIRLQIGPAMVALIAAEMLVSDVGFGYRLRIQSRILNMNVVYLYLAILGIIGFGMDWIMINFRKRLCPWFEGQR